MAYANCRSEGVQWAKAYGLPENLVFAVLSVESDCRPNINGTPTKYGIARGIAQILPSTGKGACGLSTQDLYDPKKAIPCCAQILADEFAFFGDIYLAIAAYHAGRKAVNRYKPCLPPPSFGERITGGNSTVNYVKEVCRRAGLPFNACIAGENNNQPQKEENPPVASGSSGGSGGSVLFNSSLFSRKTFIIALVVLLAIYALSAIAKR